MDQNERMIIAANNQIAAIAEAKVREEKLIKLLETAEKKKAEDSVEEQKAKDSGSISIWQRAKKLFSKNK